ncbi:alpha/beta fold hydrolase [Algiphilus sp.]|uniref:alpha/beta fold hydrolase n=1 Tax=Algiphilus sp. TaxID=1872431 RepID=UPI003C422745
MSATPIPEGQYLTTASGLRLHYQEQGSGGTTIVFLHGSGPGASGYSNFKLNYPELAAAGHRVVVPDLPGYGLSDKPEDQEYVNDFFVATVHELIEGLDLGRVVLLGNSLGGAIALGYALAHPERVQGLILMAPGGVEEREAYFEMEGIKRMMALFAEGPLDFDAMKKLLGFQLHDASQVSDDVVAERVAICADQPRTVLSTMRVPNMENRLGEITCPVLAFWGVNDQFNPPGGAQKIAAGCPNARVTLVNRCGHWVMVEHRDYFNRACIDFLAHEVAAA